MANINIEFDGNIYSVDENTLAPLASPLERALIQQLAGTGAVIRLGGTNYNVDANKLASARNVLTDHLGNVAGTDSKVTINGTEYGLSKTKLTEATLAVEETLNKIAVKFSQGLSYRLNSDGQSYSVAGIGSCEDTELIIPDMYDNLPVTSIGRSAFAFESEFGGDSGYNFISVTIPDSVTTIGSGAFFGCTRLTSITIPDGVTSIGVNAFYDTGYYNDESKWENDVLYIGNYLIKAKDSISGAYAVKNGTKVIVDSAFYSCDGLTSIDIPDSVTSIGDSAFAYCTGLTSMDIPNSVTSIGDSAFWNCSKLTNIIIPNSVTSIDSNAFYGCTRLTSITIPDGVTSIGVNAFAYCTGLTSMDIPNSVTSIGDSAFWNCSKLTNIIIPNSVTIIDTFAFSGCTKLTSIYINKPEGSISGAPWSATNATIQWNSTGPETT